MLPSHVVACVQLLFWSVHVMLMDAVIVEQNAWWLTPQQQAEHAACANCSGETHSMCHACTVLPVYSRHWLQVLGKTLYDPSSPSYYFTKILFRVVL